MDCNPGVLIVSSSSTKPKSLIKLITKTSQNLEELDGVVSFPWTIDTKYYTANVDLVGISENHVPNSKLIENTEALIIHLDSNKEKGLEDIKVWKDIENQCDPDIKILLANYCNNETKVTKKDVLNWCLKNSYEFIELFPTQECVSKDSDDEDDIREKVGVERVIEALQANTWSNLVLKGIQKPNTSTAENMKPESIESDVLSDEFLSSNGVDDFTEIFSQLQIMRESLTSIPTAQRKQCAEQVVTAFWRAIGGDEEEIADV